MYRRKRSRPIPGQLALPLDYSQSERAGPSRNPARSKARLRPWPQALPATNPAMPERRGFAPATLADGKPVNSFRQPQRFTLTSMLSALIGYVNGNRWPNGTALSPFLSRQVALVSDRGAHVGRGSLGRLPAYPLVGHQRRTRVSAVRLSRQLRLQNPQDFSLQ